MKCFFVLSKINSKYLIFVTLKHVVYKKVYIENNAYTIHTLSTYSYNHDRLKYTCIQQNVLHKK